MYSRVFTKPKRLKNKVYDVVGFTGKIYKINHNSSTVNDVTNKHSISIRNSNQKATHQTLLTSQFGNVLKLKCNSVLVRV